MLWTTGLRGYAWFFKITGIERMDTPIHSGLAIAQSSLRSVLVGGVVFQALCLSTFSACRADPARVQADRSGCNPSPMEAQALYVAGRIGRHDLCLDLLKAMVRINGTMRSSIGQGQGSTLLARTFGLVGHGPPRRPSFYGYVAYVRDAPAELHWLWSDRHYPLKRRQPVLSRVRDPPPPWRS